MPITRREFFGSVISAPAIGAIFSCLRTENDNDPLGVRKDFPVVNECTFLNSAYIAPSPVSVTQAGCAFLKAKMSNPYSLEQLLEKTEEVRRQFARFVGVSSEEIGFISSTSEGENIVVNALDFHRGENVVVDDLHYSTSFAVYKHLEETKGVELRVASSREGKTSLADYEALVDQKTRLVSVAWVSHQNGFRHDMNGLSKLAHAHGAYLYADAIQAVGMFPINLVETGVDFLASGTYKWLLAGFGVAPFFIRRDLLEKVQPDRRGHLHITKDLGSYRYEIYKDAKKFEYAMLAFISIYLLGASIAYLDRVGLNRIEAHTVGLAQSLHRGLIDLGFRLFTPPGNTSSIVTFFNPKTYEEAKKIFNDARIKVTFRGKNGSEIRTSPALFNNSADIKQFLDVAKRLQAP